MNGICLYGFLREENRVSRSGYRCSVFPVLVSVCSVRLFRFFLFIDAAGTPELVAADGRKRTHDVGILTGRDPVKRTLSGPDPAGKIRDMLIPALAAQLVEGSLEAEEVVLVGAAGAGAAQDVLGQTLRLLRAGELVVVGRADVDEAADGGRAVGRVEGRRVDRVAVDLADVKVLLHLGHLFRDDAV